MRPFTKVEWQVSLRVFGRRPVSGVRSYSEAGVRKAPREETAGKVAPTVVSVYGDLAPVYTAMFGFSKRDEGCAISLALGLVAVCRIGAVLSW